METQQKKKTSLGRRKIEIKKIEKKSQLYVTFSKRRSGIFKKAGELSVLSGAHVAVIVASPGGKVFAFGSPSVDAVIDRFLTGNRNSNTEEQFCNGIRQFSNKNAQVVRELEAEKGKEKGNFTNWWEKSIDGLGLNELEQYAAALQVLKSKVIRRANEMAAAAFNLPENYLVQDPLVQYQF